MSKNHASSDPIRDPDRLAALKATDLLNTIPEESFDRYARIASRYLDVPVSLVTLVDRDRQFFKSCVGLEAPFASEQETPLSHSFCKHVVVRHEPLVIEDAREHSLVMDNPAIEDLNVIAYLGVPLTTPEGYTLGSFCAIDQKPRSWSEEEVAFMQDLAGAVMTEIETRKSAETRFGLAKEAADVGFWQWDITTDRVVADAYTAHTFGMNTKEVDGAPLKAFISSIHEADRERVKDEITRSLEEGDPYRTEYRVVNADGNVRWVQARGRVEYGTDGEPLRFAGAITDVTERREAEIARQAAERANRAKSQFLANMSHELRTPLNAVIGYSEMLVEELESGKTLADTEEWQEQFLADLRRIHKAGEQLLNMVNDVLDLSKIEAGEMEVHPTSFEAGPMVQNTAETLRPLIEENGNELEIDCPEDLGTMHVDKTKLRQALFNLLSNAGKFTEDGRVTLRVRRETVDGQAEVHFVVEDTGIGLSEEEQEEIFKTFGQASASSTREGTGLGLTITQNLCQMMGGDIDVESEKGVGSTFMIRLPAEMRRQRGMAEPEEVPAEQESKDETPGVPAGEGDFVPSEARSST